MAINLTELDLAKKAKREGLMKRDEGRKEEEE